jgi:hypothetical protein
MAIGGPNTPAAIAGPVVSATIGAREEPADPVPRSIGPATIDPATAADAGSASGPAGPRMGSRRRPASDRPVDPPAAGGIGRIEIDLARRGIVPAVRRGLGAHAAPSVDARPVGLNRGGPPARARGSGRLAAGPTRERQIAAAVSGGVRLEARCHLAGTVRPEAPVRLAAGSGPIRLAARCHLAGTVRPAAPVRLAARLRIAALVRVSPGARPAVPDPRPTARRPTPTSSGRTRS